MNNSVNIDMHMNKVFVQKSGICTGEIPGGIAIKYL